MERNLAMAQSVGVFHVGQPFRIREIWAARKGSDVDMASTLTVEQRLEFAIEAGAPNADLLRTALAALRASSTPPACPICHTAGLTMTIEGEPCHEHHELFCLHCKTPFIAAVPPSPPTPDLTATIAESAASDICLGDIRAQTKVRDRVTQALSELAAALRHAPAPQTWEPIETAPKDGEMLLFMEWVSKTSPVVGSRDQDGRGWHINGLGWFSSEERMPTHWQPLPLPPSRGIAQTEAT